MIETAKQVKQFAEVVKKEFKISKLPPIAISALHSFTEPTANYTNWKADQTYLVSISENSKQIIFAEGSHSILHLTHRKEIVSQINDFMDGILPKK